jgi:hypothetical protein
MDVCVVNIAWAGDVVGQTNQLSTPWLDGSGCFSRFQNYFLTELQKSTVTKQIAMECVQPVDRSYAA